MTHPARLLLTLSLALTGPALAGFDQAKMQQFVDRMVETHGFQAEQVRNTLDQAEFRDDIIRLMTRPAEGKPWHEYRAIFLTRSRIEGGVRFWNEHAGVLQRAQQEYGVDPAIIVAIIGVETRYGGFTGRHRVLDALATLAFGYPKRSRFFTSELEQFLLLTQEEKLDPSTPKGSYAGAMGEPQFMPSSFRAYAADFDGDGHRDIWNNTADTVASVANYFKRHGWKPGDPVATPAQVQGERYQAVVNKGLKPKFDLANLEQHGVQPASDYPGKLPAMLLEMDGARGPEHWVAFHNFYVITRYNHSPLYALAVYQLASEIRREHRQEATAQAD